MKSLKSRIEKLEAASEATDITSLREIILVGVHPVLTADGTSHIGAMTHDTGIADPFSPAPRTVTIEHTDENPRFTARDGFTVDEVIERVRSLGN